MSTLPQSISSLSVAEKCELLDALWEDLETSGFTLSEEQTTELDRRVAAYEQDLRKGKGKVRQAGRTGQA